MSSEYPRFDLYQSVVAQAENHTLSGLQGELLTTDATLELILAALTAVEGGLSRDELVTALAEGEAQGVTLFRNLKAVPDRDYWKGVQDEAEAFWANR